MRSEARRLFRAFRLQVELEVLDIREADLVQEGRVSRTVQNEAHHCRPCSA